MGLRAILETATMPGEEPEIEELELPPEEMWAALNNTAAANVNVDKAQAPAPAPEPRPEVAKLQFIGNTKVVPLAFPFIWNGETVSEITIRRLTLGQVQEVLSSPAGEKFLMLELYAIMIGLPAAVLRGLDDDDAREVTGAAYDFLPRSLRTDDG